MRVGVLADEVAADFVYGRGDGLRAAFDNRLAKTDDAFVRVHLQEEPARPDEDGLQFRDFHAQGHSRLALRR